MATDKSSRTRKPGNSRSNNDTPIPSDPAGIKGSDRTQVLSLLTGGSNEPGSTTRPTSEISEFLKTKDDTINSSKELRVKLTLCNFAVNEQNSGSSEVISTQINQEEAPSAITKSSLLIAMDQQSKSELRPVQEKRATGIPKVISGTRNTTTPNPMRSNALDLTGSYMSILSSNPPEPSQRSIATVGDEPSASIQVNQSPDLQSPTAVWKHAMDLAGAGQTDEAARYFRIHEAMSLARRSNEVTTVTSKSAIVKNTHKLDPPSSCQTNEVFSEGGIKFIPGAVTTHMDIGFTPYFDKNLRELKGPLPLTILNRQWQELANSYHVEKRVKVENLTKDITTYTGYPYPHEMTQSYATWNTNYRNFVRTLRDVYHFKRFATWVEVHQANVEFYHTRDNWMTAFRYDIKVRLNAFAFRVSQNGTNAPPDISQRREDIAAI